MKPLKKKPLPKEPLEKDYPPLKHTWKTDADGEIDIFGYEAGDYHNGPACAKCDFGFCEHESDADKNWDDTSCLYEQALDEYYTKLREVKEYNSHVEFFNNQLRAEK